MDGERSPQMTRLLPALLLAACASDIGVTKQAQCDGVLQQQEDTVDAPFDAHGDGAFDGANPDCAATYAAVHLDCDDADPDIRPGAAEVECNGVDDDCDATTPDGHDVDADEDGASVCDDCDDADPGIGPGVTEIACNGVDDDCDAATLDDEGCVTDYTGAWTLDDTVAYSCTFGVVTIEFDRVLITDANPAVTVDALGSGAQPGEMTGTFSSSTTFSAEQTVRGTCTEVYTFEGAFPSMTTLEGTFSVEFVGSGCFDCVNQSWDVTGVR